jgi:hypothetical protein
MRNEFLERPTYKPLNDGVNWISTTRCKYIDPWGNSIVIPAGVKSDFASIPNLSVVGLVLHWLAFAASQFFWEFWFLVAFADWIIFVSEKFLHEGTWDDQAFVHDWMFKTRCRSFWKANWILFKSMIAAGSSTTKLWKRVCIFGGVVVGGYAAWIEDRPNNLLKNRL